LNTSPLPPELAWIRKLEPNERRFCELVANDRAVYAGQPVYRVGKRAQKVRAWRDILVKLMERGAIEIVRSAPNFDPLVRFLAPPGAQTADPIADIRAKLDTQPYFAPLAKFDFALLSRYVDEIRAYVRSQKR